MPADTGNQAAWIPLQPEAAAPLTTHQLLARLRRVYRNVELSVSGDRRAFRILGPRANYLALDPDLWTQAARYGAEPTVAGVRKFHIAERSIDLVFEDVWTGYYIAAHLEGRRNRNLVVLHLDDHLDMMPAYVNTSEHGWWDPTRDVSFDPLAAADWDKAIDSGSVGIGNFLTPLLHALDSIHILHLADHYAGTPMRWNLLRDHVDDDLWPATRPISVRVRDWDWANSAGTLRTCRDPAALLADLPDGVLIGHLDLDYLHNTYDGGRRAPTTEDDATVIARATERLTRLALLLVGLPRPIERWIVATSPGFCAARLWEPFLELVRTHLVHSS